MTQRILSLTAAAVLMWTVPVTAADVTRQIGVDARFQVLQLELKGATPGRYFGMWTVRRVDGVLEMCGLGVASDPSIAKVLEERQKQAQLSYNGKVVLKDISFFTKVKSASDLQNSKANCVSTGADATGNRAEVTLSFK